ncbi:MAG: ComEC/Rec2 family competence protein [Merdibacter sp.]
MTRSLSVHGDASTAAEAALLDAYDGLPCDILKLGHHGSDTSSSLRFLHAMKPQLALISVGHDNRYGHPSPSVLASLEQEGIPWLTTAENGAIRIRTTKLLKYVTTARGDFVIIGSR